MTSLGFFSVAFGRGAAFLGMLAGVLLGSSVARAAEPRTATDYFLAVPAGYGLPGVEERRALLGKSRGYGYSQADVKDDANGYLQVDNGGADPATYFAMWPHGQGGAVVGITSYHGGEGAEYSKTESLHFLRYQPGGKWTDITRKVVGGKWKKDEAYVLPREGTTVRVMRKGRVVRELTWDPAAGRFTRKKAS